MSDLPLERLLALLSQTNTQSYHVAEHSGSLTGGYNAPPALPSSSDLQHILRGAGLQSDYASHYLGQHNVYSKPEDPLQRVASIMTDSRLLIELRTMLLEQRELEKKLLGDRERTAKKLELETITASVLGLPVPNVDATLTDFDRGVYQSLKSLREKQETTLKSLSIFHGLNSNQIKAIVDTITAFL